MNNQQIQLTIISGMSGAGKTVAIQNMEDLGYFCVDNLPPVLIPKIIELFQQSSTSTKRLAIVLDLRGQEFFETALQTIQELEAKDQFDIQFLFLEARDDVLVQRYKQTRRKHPLSEKGMLLDGIEKERNLLQEIKGKSKHVIDTSDLTPKQLKEKLSQRFSQTKSNQLTLNIVSFGFKYGIPIDADLVFDVRFLDNPFYVEDLRPQTGLDRPVSSYVLNQNKTQVFLKKLEDMLSFLLPLYKAEGKDQVVIAIGCSGGKHRSVTIVEHLLKRYQSDYKAWETHRDIEKNKSMYQVT